MHLHSSFSLFCFLKERIEVRRESRLEPTVQLRTDPGIILSPRKFLRQSAVEKLVCLKGTPHPLTSLSFSLPPSFHSSLFPPSLLTYSVPFLPFPSSSPSLLPSWLLSVCPFTMTPLSLEVVAAASWPLGPPPTPFPPPSFPPRPANDVTEAQTLHQEPINPQPERQAPCQGGCS